MRWLGVVLLSVVVLACPSKPLPDAGTGGGGGSGGGAGAGAGGGTGGGGGSGGGTEDGGIAGVELLGLLPGLWSGPATMTPLGNFPQMNFDLRPVDGQRVFGQADLDANDNLRFGFSIETYGGRDVLAFRNGGYFTGVLRDSRTALTESDGGTWRFCSVGDGGCDYLDARFTFVSADHLVLDTHVRNQPHVYWDAQRVEHRGVPSFFPTDLTSQGDGSAPWPSLPTVQVNVTWPTPTAAAADVWLVLTTTPCFPTFACHASRSLSTQVMAGATSASLSLPSVHPGGYDATVVLDLDQNFASTLAPSSGDKVAVDLPLDVPDAGTATLSASPVYTVP